MLLSRTLAILLSLTTLAHASGPADAAGLKERLHRAEVESSLDADGMPPWYLKLSVQLYDSKGNPTDQTGTIEQWRIGPKLYRTVYTMPKYTAIKLRNENGLYVSGSHPSLLTDLLAQVVHPMPELHDIDDSQPESNKENFGQVSLDCVMLSQPMVFAANPPGLFPTYCFDPGGDTLRASYNYGSQYILRNSFALFAGRRLPRSITFDENGIVTATAKVLALTTTTRAAAELDRVENLRPVPTGLASVPAGVVAGMIVSKMPPVYPEIAKRNHVSGAVVLRATIGRDGHVLSLRLLKAPDPNLASSAIAAVRQWVYTPWLLNGEVSEIDTIITVHYNMGSF